jgi:hypothetical protein
MTRAVPVRSLEAPQPECDTLPPSLVSPVPRATESEMETNVR